MYLLDVLGNHLVGHDLHRHAEQQLSVLKKLSKTQKSRKKPTKIAEQSHRCLSFFASLLCLCSQVPWHHIYIGEAKRGWISIFWLCSLNRKNESWGLNRSFTPKLEILAKWLKFQLFRGWRGKIRPNPVVIFVHREWKNLNRTFFIRVSLQKDRGNRRLSLKP